MKEDIQKLIDSYKMGELLISEFDDGVVFLYANWYISEIEEKLLYEWRKTYDKLCIIEFRLWNK